MGRRNRKGRAVDGVFLLNKPSGISSNRALQMVKRIFNASKAGHTGSLDPLATGVLPICFGESTKFSQYLLDSDKAYRSTFRFGQITTSADSEGDILKEYDASSLTELDVTSAMPRFEGAINQVPPMVSALKYQGKRLYELAREGVEVERPARPVNIYQYDLNVFRSGQLPEAQVSVRCSKGTYIRSLAHDLGEVLGVGAHVVQLHRSAVADFSDKDSMTLECLEQHSNQADFDPQSLDQYLLPVDAPIDSLPVVNIGVDQAFAFRQGKCIDLDESYRNDSQDVKVRVYQVGGHFLGVAELSQMLQLTPKRLVATN